MTGWASISNRETAGVYRKFALFVGLYLLLSIGLPALMMLGTARAGGARGVTVERWQQVRLEQRLRAGQAPVPR
jgi:hypothetical protein